jgi:hypothetical protein
VLNRACAIQLGIFLQAFSHVPLIMAAFALEAGESAGASAAAAL